MRPGFAARALLAFVLASCGQKPNPQLGVGLTPESVLKDAAALDIVFVATNIPENGKSLTNRDGSTFYAVFPNDSAHPCCPSGPPGCPNPIPRGCGIALASAVTVDLGTLPLGYKYKLDTVVRDAVGGCLYEGSQEFENDGTTPGVSILLGASTSTSLLCS